MTSIDAGVRLASDGVEDSGVAGESFARAISSATETAATADESLARTLSRVLEAGGGSTEAGTDELIDYQVVLTDPLARITTARSRPLNIIGAVARLIWMVSHSDRLEDIAFYESKVRKYTDDGISVPGSNYGQRIFQPAPNLDQIADGVIPRLAADQDSRRAAVVIWNAHDAVRTSNDIPCAFGAFYHVRDERLIATTIMRSNNALRLLPFNTFEFSLIAEMVARSVGLELGAYVHFAASMHVYAADRAAARETVDAFALASVGGSAAVMPKMPPGPEPLAQAKRLASLEAALRHNHVGLASASLEELARPARDDLDPYWASFYEVLLAYCLARATRYDEADEVADRLPEYFRRSVADSVRRMRPAAVVTPASSQIALFDLPLSTGLSPISAAFEPSLSEERMVTEQFYSHLEVIGRERMRDITLPVIRRLHRELVVDRPIALAARSDDQNPEDGAQARNRLSRGEVEAALRRIERELGGAI